MEIMTDPKFYEGFPVISTPAGTTENDQEEQFIRTAIDTHPEGKPFTFVEVGAGYGRWSAIAAAYARDRGVDLKVIAVEADPVHFQWLNEHLDTNHITNRTLYNQPVTHQRKFVLFHTGRPGAWYGQSVVHRGPAYLGYYLLKGDRFSLQRTMTLEDVLQGCDHADFVDIDIQGEELRVLEATPDHVIQKIHTLYIGTHSAAIHRGLKDLMVDRGFTLLYELPKLDDVKDQDGVQVWQ